MSTLVLIALFKAWIRRRRSNEGTDLDLEMLGKLRIHLPEEYKQDKEHA